MQLTSFYLHSKKNCQLYPRSKYPLTHLLDYQSSQDCRSKQSIYVKHFKYTLLLLFLFTLISTIFFRVHIYAFNAFFGPFHFNLNQFVQHVKDFEKGQSWFYRIEYIQIEIGENNILNPKDSQSTIRKYSDSSTRQRHIATYKKMKQLNIYVKLPTRHQNSFHAHHPFYFSSFSIRTLKCIVKHLQSNQFWLEKSDYIKFIQNEYAKNSTLFNILVLTKCGILVGYLYRPQFDLAFIPTREHTFYPNDIAFDATRQYCSYIPLVISMIIFLWLFSKSLFYLFIYLFNIVRLKLHFKMRIFSFSLNFSTNIVDELWLLNIQGQPYEQLLKLDELIQETSDKFDERLFLIKNDYGELLVVLLNDKYDENIVLDEDQSPFVICPVSNILKIVQYQGICYTDDLSWIPWPSTMTEGENYAEWLHEKLMELSEDYRNHYEYRLQNEFEPVWNNNEVRQRRRMPEISTELKKFIVEERNYQRLRLERQTIVEQILEPINAASPEFIAQFRLEQNLPKYSIDKEMEEQNLTCRICLEDFHFNDTYRIWPCPSNTPHIFHDECMLNILRRKNTCPICRHPVEINQNRNQSLARFFTNLVF